MTHLIEVAFSGNRKAFFQWTGDAPPPLRAPIIVEADRGEDMGHVHAIGELAQKRCSGCAHGCGSAPEPTDRALRLASADEVARSVTLKEENETARRTSHERARAAGLVMKISDAEWQWDRRKLTLYFTAEKRIDFRALVRELAGLFRTRIELKQIGVRDEAKRLSGIGRCGREYCSASWLPDLRPVNLGVAKDQRLSLNPTQISGACGRLMCCLRYEHEFYVQSRRRFPKEGKILRTATGEEKVVTCDIFRDTVTLRNPEGDTRVVPLAVLREEVALAGGGPMSAGAAVASLDDDATDAQIETSSGDAIDARAVDDRAGTLETAEYEIASTTELRIALSPEPRIDVIEDPDPTLDGADTEDSDADADGSDAPAESRDTSSSTTLDSAEEQARRKRRRGRRGGRRLRGERGPREDGRTDDPGSSTPPASNS
jgi:cell fate regulator YaaT (PSP1 superfamily)